MKKAHYLILLIILIGMSCVEPSKINEAGTISIGAVYNLSGDQSPLDVPSSKGAKLAINQANMGKLSDGRKFELILKDGRTNPDTLRKRVREIMEQTPEVIGFIGLSDTDQVLAAASEAAENDRVFITSGATSPLLPSEVQKYLFMACFGDNVQAAAAAEFAIDQKAASSAIILFDTTDIYTSLLKRYFVECYKELGGDIISIIGYSSGNLESVIDSIGQAGLLYFAALPQDVLSGIRAIRNAGLNMPIIGGDSYDQPEAWKGQTGLGEVYYTTHVYLGPDNPDTTVQAFIEEYKEANNGEYPDAFAALGFDACRLLIKAYDHAGSTDPVMILEELSRIKEFKGVSGAISFENGQRIPRKSVTIMNLKEGVSLHAMELTPKKIPAP